MVPDVKTKWSNLKVKEIASPSDCVSAAGGDDGTPGLTLITTKIASILREANVYGIVVEKEEDLTKNTDKQTGKV